MKTVIKLCLTITFLLCAYSYVDAQTLCTESRCYKLQDELGFYIDVGNPLNTQTVTPGVAALTPCNENRCIKLVDKNGNYIDINNPLPTTSGGGGGGTTIPAFSGFVVQTPPGSFVGRSITVGSAKLTIVNGDGILGNVSVDLGSVASTDLSDTANIMLLNGVQTNTGVKTFNTNTLKGTDAWLTNGLKDVNGNFIFHTTAVASAVNYLDCQNAADGNPATITCTATGSSTNIGINFVPKGTGPFSVGTGPSTGPLQGGSLVLNGTTGSATIGVAAAAGTPANINLPTATGAANSYLMSDGGTPQQTSWNVPTCSKLSDSSIFCTASGATNAQSATYQVVAADFTNLKPIIVASGTFTITLVASGSQPANGKYITVINYGSGVVTIARSGQNINGGTASYVMSSSSATNPSIATVVSDGTNYFIGGGFTNPMTVAGDTIYSGTTGLPTKLAIGGANTVLHGGASAPAYSAVTGSDMTANTVTSTQMAVVNTRRVCDIAVGDTSGSVITNAQLGPQKRICYIPAASTVVEVDVAADAGTPNVIMAKNSAGSVSNLVSSALATASSGGIACSKTTGVTGIDGVTTCSATLQNTSLAAGDYIELVSGTAGGTAKLMTIHVIYTVN